jgi:phosphatidate cytidylyltransferase
MALNVPVFFTRLSSALVFGAIMMLGLFGYDVAFFGIFFIVNVLCLREFATLVSPMLGVTFKRNEIINFIAVGVFVFVWVASLSLQICNNSLNQYLHQFSFHLLGCVIGTLFIFFIFMKNKKAIYLLTGIGYISLSLGLLMQLRYQSLLLPMMLIFFIWMNDTMAYLTGSFVGKTPFFPSISPKKTWEGIIGGLIFTLLLACIWGYFSPHFLLWQWIVMGLIASVFGNAGDLVESKIKRLAGVKDSGSMMPGHGGALDRFDSLIVAAPVAFIFAVVCMACK